jgi:hypothetical protein
MFERAIYEKTLSIWASEEIRCSKPHITPPNLEALRAVVDTAFLASLKREEGRPLGFSVALITGEELDATNKKSYPDGAPQVIMKFPQSLPLNVEVISKLAGAFDKDTTALAVEQIPDASPSSYQIWGAIFYGPTRNLFNEVPMGGGGFSIFKPDCLIVTTAAVGSLIIARRDHLLGYFEAGRFERSVPTPFTSEAMGNYIIRAAQGNKGWDPQNRYWHVYIRALEFVLAEASSRGHGGTIILIPPANEASATDLYQPTYSFEGDLGIGFHQEQTITTQNNHSPIYEYVKRLLSFRLEAFAQLAAIDGALVSTTEWKVLAFGAKLIAPRWTKDVLVGPDSFGGGGGTFERAKLGTRHNSAIDFIGACPGAIGFVLSEDGPIRGLAKRDNDTILCWPDCRVSMFV